MTAEPILVTGVGRRLGLALARSLLARGVPVIGTFRSERPGVDVLRAAGAELHRCDFEEDAQIRSLIAEIQGRHERLRAIVHNASDWHADDDDPAATATLHRMLQVHVVAPYQINRALAPALEASLGPWADIIHVGDYVSARGSRKHIAYAASKAAQDNLTLSFAARLAPKVKVNSIAPALMLFNDDDDAEYRRRALEKSLMRREGGEAEFLRAVDYLLESGYVTGRILPLDGGRHLV